MYDMFNKYGANSSFFFRLSFKDFFFFGRAKRNGLLEFEKFFLSLRSQST